MSRHAWIAAAAAGIAISSPAKAGPVEDATASLTATMDKFNAGDAAAFVAAHSDNAVIVDEFAPYLWGGDQSAKRWIEAYGKDAEGKGISGGRVDYGKPLQANGTADAAYIVLPTTYRFMQKGKKMAGAGSMTFVMIRSDAGWKIASWTYAGALPAPEK